MAPDRPPDPVTVTVAELFEQIVLRKLDWCCRGGELGVADLLERARPEAGD